MAPPPESRISGTAAWVIRNGPVRFTSITRCHSSGVVSISGLNTAIPALLTSASRRPNRSVTAAISRATDSRSATSQCSAMVRSGSASACIAARSPSSSRSSSATDQPSARKRLAAASPMPRAAPVTSATWGEDAVMGVPIMRKRGGQTWKVEASHASAVPSLSSVARRRGRSRLGTSRRHLVYIELKYNFASRRARHRL